MIRMQMIEQLQRNIAAAEAHGEFNDSDTLRDELEQLEKEQNTDEQFAKIAAEVDAEAGF